MLAEVLGVSRWYDGGSFHHENDGAIRSTCSVDDASRYDIALPWSKVNRLALQINNEVPIENKEKLVVVVMSMPMILTLHDS